MVVKYGFVDHNGVHVEPIKIEIPRPRTWGLGITPYLGSGYFCSRILIREDRLGSKHLEESLFMILLLSQVPETPNKWHESAVHLKAILVLLSLVMTLKMVWGYRRAAFHVNILT